MSLGGVMQSKSQACASGRRDSGRLCIPRTRTGDFRPATLPALYQRGYSEETQIGSSWRFGSLPALSCSRLLSRLAFGRALNAVKNAAADEIAADCASRAPVPATSARLPCLPFISAATAKKPRSVLLGGLVRCLP